MVCYSLYVCEPGKRLDVNNNNVMRQRKRRNEEKLNNLIGNERKKVKTYGGIKNKLAAVLVSLLLLVILAGCSMMSDERVKVRDLEFTVLGEEKIPEELLAIMTEKGGEPFQLTYSDNEFLYISVGYGEQPTGGYSICVNELYLTDNAVYVSTSLLGPDTAPQSNGTPSYPCIVIKTEYLDKTVIFE